MKTRDREREYHWHSDSFILCWENGLAFIEIKDGLKAYPFSFFPRSCFNFWCIQCLLVESLNLNLNVFNILSKHSIQIYSCHSLRTVHLFIFVLEKVALTLLLPFLPFKIDYNSCLIENFYVLRITSMSESNAIYFSVKNHFNLVLIWIPSSSSHGYTRISLQSLGKHI